MTNLMERPSNPNSADDIAGESMGVATLVAIHYESEMTDSERETIESQRFRDFLPTKNGCMVFALTGHDNIG